MSRQGTHLAYVVTGPQRPCVCTAKTERERRAASVARGPKAASTRSSRRRRVGRFFRRRQVEEDAGGWRRRAGTCGGAFGSRGDRGRPTVPSSSRRLAEGRPAPWISADGGAVTTLTTVRPKETFTSLAARASRRRVTCSLRSRLPGQAFDDAIIATVPIDGRRADGPCGRRLECAVRAVRPLRFTPRPVTVLATEFDPGRRARPSGATMTVIDSVRTTSINGALPLAVSSTRASLVYLPGPGRELRAWRCYRANRAGQTQSAARTNELLDNAFGLSPDGKRVAAQRFMTSRSTSGSSSSDSSRPCVALRSAGVPRRSRCGAADGSLLYYGSNARAASFRAVVKARRRQR